MTQAMSRVALYVAVGPELTHYEVDVAAGTLTRRGDVQLPANVQDAWPFDLPSPPATAIDGWRRWIDTSRESPEDITDVSTAPVVPETRYRVAPRSVTALFLRIDPDSGLSQSAAPTLRARRRAERHE